MATKKNNFRTFEHILYRLRRQYRNTIEVYMLDSSTPNRVTGVNVKVYTKYTVNDAIVLPIEVAKQFVYDLHYISANRNFTEGGYFERLRVHVLIDNNKVPDGVEFYPDVVVGIDGKRYQVRYVIPLPTDNGFHLILESSENAEALPEVD